MRKLYSIVLMAAALLIGTNAWADYPANWLQAQFDTVHTENVYGTVTITMEDDITLTAPVYLGTATVDEPRKSIILDMNGHNITMSATEWESNHHNVFCSMFNITHGELLVRNSDKSKTSLIQMLGTSVGNYNDIFNVAGSYKSSRWVKNGNSYEIDESAAINTRAANGGWFTHLEIGEGVKLFAANTVNGAGISIDGYYTLFHGQVSPDETLASVFGNTGLTGGAGNLCLKNRADAPQYNTAILSKASEGVAYGVRVEVYGDIEFASESTTSGGKSYGIKLNGGLRSSLRSPEKFENQYCWAMDAAYAQTYGATAATPTEITIDSTSATAAYKKAYFDHRLDTVDAPFLYIGKNAHIIAAAEMNEATAIYASGYGKTLIEGLCSGNSGVNIKSGTVEMHDAEIICTATETSVYAAENGNKATGTGAVVVNSVDGRAGGIEVIISGDSKVSTDYGYAIAETVTANNDGTKVTSITIDGGTIQGGASTATNDGGAIIVSETTKNNKDADVVVYGTNLTGNTNVQAGGTGDLDDLLPQTGAVITEVIVDGKPTIVVSQGETPDEVDEAATDSEHSIMNANETSITWTGTVDQIIDGNKTLDYLEMNLTTGTTPKTPVPQQLTIESGYTLTVGRVVLGEAAVIIVKPGAKFIVTGTQGIVAPVASNIVLNASEDLQSIFLFNPAVSSNRDPMAQFKIYTECHEIAAKTAGMKNFVYQRFALPITVAAAPTHDYTNQPLYTGNTAFRTYVKDYNPATNEWEALTSWASLKGFQGYQLGNTTANGGITYTFAGHLYGNQNHDCSFDVPGFEFFGNSYSAPLYIDNLLAAYQNTNIEPTVWIYNYDTRSFAIINEDARLFDSENVLPKEIKTMQAYALYLRNGSDKASINYKNVVWENPNFDELLGRSNQNNENNAPARNRMNAMNNGALISVMAENGMKDQVILIEKDSYSSNFDNGADAPKLMVEDGINLYVTTADGNLSIVADNNIENTTLTFKAGEATEYTLQLGKVFGEDYAIRDNVTGAIINCAEGMTYFFNQAANTTAFGRFEIVGRQNMPTAIDNTEAVKSAKGIYSITGMYLGEDLNVLPAGVYVVNGVKVVK